MQVAPNVTHGDAPAVAAKAARATPEDLVHHFRVPGRSLRFTLRKRRPGRWEPWYFVSIVAGRRFHHSTQATDVKLAEEVAKVKYVLPALAQDWKRVEDNKLKRRQVSVGELLKVWEALKLGAEAAHKHQAANQLRNVLRQAGYENPDSEPCSVLRGGTALAYFDKVAEEAEAALSQVLAARRKRTGVRTWCQAICVVQKAALVAYEEAELAVPDVAEFLGRGAMRVKRMKKESKLQEAPPDLDLMGRLLAEWPALPWNEFAAIGLALAFGLRASEWRKARWEWFKVSGERWCLDTETDVKNKTGQLKVTALNPFWRTFTERAEREGKRVVEGYVLAGEDNERKGVEKLVSAWMRSKGWKGQKTNHAFRAYAGALVVLRWGHGEAKHWLRHASVTTTEKHYTDRWRDEQRGRAVVVEWAGA